MTNQEVLTKAIEKAEANGWKNEEGIKPIQVEDHCFITKGYVPKNIFFGPAELIFDHDFAKALWGDKVVDSDDNGFSIAWQYHLQQMVIADDPLNYLKEHL